MLIPVPGRIATRNVARGPSAVLILTVGTAPAGTVQVGRISRRTALGCLAGVGVAANVGLESAQAQGEPNSFVLDGAETRISYGTTSIRGIPILIYDGPFGDPTFEGDGIRTAATPSS